MGASRQVDTAAIPAPERYTLTGQLCRPCKSGLELRPDMYLLWGQDVLVDRQIISFLGWIGRQHGFPRMRVTVEVLTEQQSGSRRERLCPHCSSLWWLTRDGVWKCPNCGHSEADREGGASDAHSGNSDD